MVFNIEELDKELQETLKEFSLFTFNNTGCKIIAKQGKDAIIYNEDNVTITYSKKASLVYLLFLFDTIGKTGEIDCAFEKLSCMVDMSRNSVRTVETLKRFMRLIVLMGYTEIQIYMEDVYEIPDEPYFGYKRGKYTQKELKQIAAYAKILGLKCVPCIQTLAHIGGITRWRKFALSVIDTDDILLAEEEKTYELIEKMFQSLRECFECEEIHLGMDEAYRVGLGKYLDIHGYVDRSSIVVKHLQRVVSLANKYGFSKPMIWNDMFVRLANKGNYLNAENAEIAEDILRLIPENLTLACWNYYRLDKKFYENMIVMQKKFQRPLYYASGAITWLGVTPMNQFSIRQNTVAMETCKNLAVENYMVTIWGDDGGECSIFSALPTLAYVGAKAYEVKEYKKIFERLTGIPFDKFLHLDLPNQVTDPCRMFVLCQPAKYMLYNDCLLGLYDSQATEGDGKKYKGMALKLHKLSADKNWGYLFYTQEMLAKILYYKYELTLKTRNAYQSGDRATLWKIVKVDYKKIIKYLEEYYEALRAQWYKENKGYGFEEQDYRLGGLRQRLLNGQRVLKAYLNNEIERIEELEEPVLSVLCNEEMNGKGMDARSFREVTSVKIIL